MRINWIRLTLDLTFFAAGWALTYTLVGGMSGACIYASFMFVLKCVDFARAAGVPERAERSNNQPSAIRAADDDV